MVKEKEKRLKVLILEPYYGGSHRSFLESLRHLPFELEFMTLPARKWKWRMRLSAPYFAELLYKTDQRFDRILCSSFVDVAAFRGMAPHWVREVPILTYFHENQFSYPVQVEDERDLHFGLTNMTSALSSDSLAFNSSYNLNSFLSGMEKVLAFSPDLRIAHPGEIIRKKSLVLPPAIDFSEFDAAEKTKDGGVPVILWNHRWEYDKNPDLFFNALSELDIQGVDFRIIVLGQSYERQPPVFRVAQEKLAHKMLHFGFVESASEYVRLIAQGDIVVSTALHEFFGIAVIEAVRAGCRPLLPKRLSYPELFPEEFLYEEGDFLKRLKHEVTRKARLTNDQAQGLTDRFSLESLAPAYTKWIKEAHVSF